MKYQAIFLDTDEVNLKVTSMLNPVLFLSTSLENSGEIEWDCSRTIERVYFSQEDPKDTALERPDCEVYTDGSSYVEKGRWLAGYVVVFQEKAIKAKALLPNTSAQKVELVALERALTCSQGKRVNIWTDSKYAFGVEHAHGAIWKERSIVSSRVPHYIWRNYGKALKERLVTGRVCSDAL